MYPKLEGGESKTPGYSRESKNRDKGITGFNHEQISSDKNPTEEVDPIIEPTIIPELENQNYFGKIHHSGFADNDEKQEMVQYAYSLGGIDFVKMIECENGNWNIKAIGDSGKAFGLCQINTRYHKLPNEYKTNWRVQVEYCYEKRSTGTRFYGPSRKVKGTSCANYVSDRFTIIE